MTIEWIREGLQSLIKSVGLRVDTFVSAQDFLAAKRPDVPACLVLDVRMPSLCRPRSATQIERGRDPHPYYISSPVMATFP